MVLIVAEAADRVHRDHLEDYEAVVVWTPHNVVPPPVPVPAPPRPQELPSWPVVVVPWQLHPYLELQTPTPWADVVVYLADKHSVVSGRKTRQSVRGVVNKL